MPGSPTPRVRLPLSRSPCAGRALWRGCLARRTSPCWLAVVTLTPLGHCVDPRVETPHRILLGSVVVSWLTPCRTVPYSRSWRARPRPEELVKYASQPLLAAGDRWTSSTVHSPVARAYPRVVSAAFFITAGISLFFQRTGSSSIRLRDFARKTSAQDIGIHWDVHNL